MLVLNEFLTKAGLEPKTVAVMLHTPSTPKLRRLLPWLARARRDVFEAYQSSHGKPATATLRNRAFVASFVGLGDGTLVLAGVYRNLGVRERAMSEIMADKVVAELVADFGVTYETGGMAPATWLWFDLQRTELLGEYVGRLRIAPRLTQAYVRLAENFPGEIVAVERASLLDAAPPDWRDMTLSASELRVSDKPVLPESWAVLLRGWRGIYLIVDESDGKRYVGAAYGKENLLGRWRAHIAGEHGVTKELGTRKTDGFRFSILEVLRHDEAAEEVIRREQSWMNRLHTRQFGLNA